MEFNLFKSINWKGLSTTSPLSYPKATLIFLNENEAISDSFSSKFIQIDDVIIIKIFHLNI